MNKFRCCFKFSFSVLLIAVLFTSSWVRAEKATTPLSRSEAMALSVAKHPRLNLFASRIKRASARVTQARAGFMPQVSFVERYSRTNNPMWAFGTKLNQETISQADFDPKRLNDPDGMDNFVSTLDVKWPIYDSGQTWYGWRQACNGVEAADIEYERARQEVVAGAAIAYDGLLLASARLRVIDQSISLARAHLNLVEERYRAGFVVKSDLLRAQVRIADLQQKRFEAESGEAVAMAALSAAMGESTDCRFLPTDNLKTDSCKTASIDNWIALALDNRPELQLTSRQETIARHELNKRKSRHLPAVSLFGSYEVNTENFDDTGDNYTIGAMVAVDLFSGGRTVSQIHEARSALAAVQAMGRDLRSNVEVEVRKAFHDACSARQRIGVAEETIGQSRENRRIVTDRYATGLLTIVALLDAETVVESARNSLNQAMHDYRVSNVRLQLAAGILDTGAE